MTVPIVRFTVRGLEEARVLYARPYTVVYDGACKVCNRLVRLLSKWDRADLITSVPSQTPGVRTIAERFYVWFARNRYRLGCGEHCQYRPADLDFGDV